MTTFKILITFLTMFIFSMQTVMALPGNTNSVSFTPVHASETGAQKSPAPAEDEHFVPTRKVLPWHLQQAEEMQLFGGKSHVLLFMRASGSELLMLGGLGLYGIEITGLM
ncbi:hypothetical protein BDV30DRAFT_232718 [Aspergillus minisclerotigenes]|uniref:Uncharacterized protein n=1 Tax=Aspergillus minisclerotigenes TaxID=656917 RepID=A0A5N6JP63_9EURO|nr:hypothetical protein BDV30DRAFT_232718 [Aspergillus minisclerotigenes]